MGCHQMPPQKQDPQDCDNANSVETQSPPIEQGSHRSIGMHALLNPSQSQPPARESRSERKHGLDTPSTSPNQPPLSQDRSSASRPRRIITPISPGSQGLTAITRPNLTPGTISAIQSPFLQSPESQASASGTHESVEGSRGAFSASFRRFSQPYPAAQLTPPYDDRRLSSGELSDPRSQTNSPSTPHSLYSQFSRASPILGQGPPQQPLDSSSHPHAGSMMSTWNQSLPQYRAEREPHRNNFPQLAIHNGHDVIPIEIDVESASSRANEKRSNNRDASKRHRDRKKDAEAEKARTLELQEQKIKFLTEERNHYHSELEYFRDIVNRTTGLGRIPARPLSPRHRRPMSLPSGKPSNEEPLCQGDGRGDPSSGRNTRRKLNPEQSSLPTPPPGTSLTPLPPLGYTMGPLQPPYPASSWPTGPSRHAEAGGQHPPRHMTPYPPSHETQLPNSIDRSWNPAA